MTSPPLIVIFGAAIRADGRPSAALLRRTGYGLAAAQAYPQALILCSGGAARPGQTEAAIIAERLMAAGVSPDRLIRDDESLTTLQNVAAAARQVRNGGHGFVIACSDGWHLPRIRLTLAFFGVKFVRGPVSNGRREVSWRHQVAMCLRESVAIPVYLLILIVRGRRIRP